MTPIEIAVISVVIIFGFAAWLIARKRGADEWAGQHEAGKQTDRRLTHARNRVEFYKLELAKAERAKQGGIGTARAKLNDAVNVVLKLEGASK